MDKTTLQLKQKLATITHLIEQEKQRGIPNGLEALEARYRVIDSIERLLDEVETSFESNTTLLATHKTVYELRGRLKQLAHLLPSLKKIKRAQNLLSFENLRILEIDEHAHEENYECEIIHALVLNHTGAIVFDRFIQPRQKISEETSHTTGVIAQDMENAPTLPEVWSELLAVLSGGYVVAFDLLRYSLALVEAAQQYQLEVPALIGESLEKQCCSYFRFPEWSAWGRRQFSSLEHFCQHIGSPLPHPPQQTARDRAAGQLRVIQAMAQGFVGEIEETSAPWSSSRESDIDDWEFERDELNENPF